MLAYFHKQYIEIRSAPKNGCLRTPQYISTDPSRREGTTFEVLSNACSKETRTRTSGDVGYAVGGPTALSLDFGTIP